MLRASSSCSTSCFSRLAIESCFVMRSSRRIEDSSSSSSNFSDCSDVDRLSSSVSALSCVVSAYFCSQSLIAVSRSFICWAYSFSSESTVDRKSAFCSVKSFNDSLIPLYFTCHSSISDVCIFTLSSRNKIVSLSISIWAFASATSLKLFSALAKASFSCFIWAADASRLSWSSSIATFNSSVTWLWLSCHWLTISLTASSCCCKLSIVDKDSSNCFSRTSTRAADSSSSWHFDSSETYCSFSSFNSEDSESFSFSWRRHFDKMAS